MKNVHFLKYFGYPGGLYCVVANTVFLIACWKARLTTKPAQHRSLYLQLFCLGVGGFLLGVGRLLETAKDTIPLAACVKVNMCLLVEFCDEFV